MAGKDNDDCAFLQMEPPQTHCKWSYVNARKKGSAPKE